MSACRSGCPTQDHGSWGECARAARVGIGRGETSPAFMAAARNEKEILAYKAAREQGIQPASTRMKDISAAVTASKIVDKPYDAASGTFKD